MLLNDTHIHLWQMLNWLERYFCEVKKCEHDSLNLLNTWKQENTTQRLRLEQHNLAVLFALWKFQ
jgi:hypothetical protein